MCQLGDTICAFIAEPSNENPCSHDCTVCRGFAILDLEMRIWDKQCFLLFELVALKVYWHWGDKLTLSVLSFNDPRQSGQ